jgi:hypothetical protein
MRKHQALAILIFLLTVSACELAPPKGPAWRCPALPASFKNSDLIGVWQGRRGGAKEQLTIEENGTYQQIYRSHVPEAPELGARGKWWLEQAPSGGLYLHLEGMRKCDSVEMLCREGDGGGAVNLWADFCANRAVQMPGEVVLIVTGLPPKTTAARGIVLWQMPADPDSGTYFFTLEQ